MSRTPPPVLLSRPLLAPLAIAISTMFCGSALAEPGDVFVPYVSVMASHDDNLYRLGSEEEGQRRLGTTNLSDTSRRLGVGLDIDKMISQQRLIASLNMSRTTYDRFSNLNNDGKNASVKLNWHLGSKVEGNVGTSYVEALTPFSDFRTTERNIRSQKRVFADAAWRFHPSWRISTSASRDQLSYDLSSQRANDRNLNSEIIGIDYLSAGNGSIGLQMGHSTGAYRYPELLGQFQIANDYSQDDFKAKIDWIATGKTRLQFLGGLVQRKHDAFSDRDFSGFNARLVATHQLTGKITLTANVYREIGSVDDTTASYTLNNGVSVVSSWSVSSKIRLDAQIRNEKRAYAGTPILPSIPLSDRADTYRNLSLTANYMPTRKWTIGLNAYRDQQSSNQAIGAYRANGMTLNTRYEF
ncbi:XrtB/PEP-CTERM-associated polysaccharide biosynthesis outer membrane protein EpsL [Actimicrobium antarcticum]